MNPKDSGFILWNNSDSPKSDDPDLPDKNRNFGFWKSRKIRTVDLWANLDWFHSIARGTGTTSLASSSWTDRMLIFFFFSEGTPKTMCSDRRRRPNSSRTCNYRKPKAAKGSAFRSKTFLTSTVRSKSNGSWTTVIRKPIWNTPKNNTPKLRSINISRRVSNLLSNKK